MIGEVKVDASIKVTREMRYTEMAGMAAAASGILKQKRKPI